MVGVFFLLWYLYDCTQINHVEYNCILPEKYISGVSGPDIIYTRITGSQSDIWTQSLCTHFSFRIHWSFSPCFLSPLAESPLLPFAPHLALLLTWKPSFCDRIRAPRSQVTRELTSPSLTLPISSPLQIPRTQVNKRFTTTTSRIRLLLSGTDT
jgi:hypothetical protein